MHRIKNHTRTAQNAGFTFIDLIVTLAVIAVALLLILPAMARTRVNSPAAVCLNNLRQLSSSWMMYSADNSGSLVWSYPNLFGNPTAYSWCYGNANGTAGSYSYDGTDPNGLKNAKLWPYIKSIPTYKCGADQRVATISGVVKPILRSYSMNGYLAGRSFGDPMGTYDVVTGGQQSGRFRVYLKDIELRYPAKTFVFLDEDAISINDCMLMVNMGGDPRGLIDLPGRQHDGAYGVNFADGHATMNKLYTPEVLTATTMPVGNNANIDYRNLTNITTFPQQ